MKEIYKKERSPKVTVGIPVYRVERYMERCARSLFEQTLDDVEYIFVDDKTPDNSMKILESVIKDYPGRVEQIKIIRHTVNKGSATSRNTILENATGEYIIFCDSDDWVERDMYEKLYIKAKSENADIVWSSITIVFSNDKVIRKRNQYCTKEKLLYNIIVGLESGQVLTRLVKRSLYVDNNISFPDGFDMMEDFTVIIRLLFYSQRIVFSLDNYYYLNRMTTDNISTINNYNTKKWQNSVIHNIELIDRFLCCNVEKDYFDAIREAKLQCKVLIAAFAKDVDKVWLHRLWPEIESNPFKISSWKMKRKVYIWLNMKRLINPNFVNKIKRIRGLFVYNGILV